MCSPVALIYAMTHTHITHESLLALARGYNMQSHGLNGSNDRFENEIKEKQTKLN